MKPMHILLLMCAAFGYRPAASVPGDRHTGNEDLMDAIKLNLRKNNDDYTDAPDLKTATEFPTYTKNKIKSLRRANMYLNSKTFDKNLMNELENNIIDINSTNGYPKNKFENWKIKPIITDPKLNTLSIQNQQKITTQMRAFLKSNRSKIEKFQKFFEQNKDLFKEFMSSKLAARTKNNGVYGLIVKGTGKGRKSKGDKAHNKGWLEDESGTTEPLDPDRLDMLPAIGGRIHYWRIQGRLCHRHVVMPEGPKYDSKGRVYLPAHIDHVQRPYNVTRRHKFLLPKCCNCCKKSVLGCE